MTPPDARQSDEKWRIGTSWGIHVYQGEKGSPGERPVATFHDPADAQRAVDAVNGGTDGRQLAVEELRKAASGIGAGAGIAGLPLAVKQALGIAGGVLHARADELTNGDPA